MNNASHTHGGAWIELVPAALVVIIALTCLVLWRFSHRAPKPGDGLRPRPALFAGWLGGSAALWFSLLALTRIPRVDLLTPIPLAVLAMTGAAAIEGVIALYRFELRSVTGTAGRYITALRVTAIVLLLLVISEPVIVREVVRRHERTVVVMLDRSGSMNLTDPQAGPDELMELAGLYGLVENSGDYEPSRIEQLDQEKIPGIEKLRDKTRLEIGRRILRDGGNGRSLVNQLERKYEVLRLDFAATPRPAASDNGGQGNMEVDDHAPAEEDWPMLTDLAAALEYPLENIPAESLAGIILISDCRDVAGSRPEAVAYQLGRRSVPVYPLVVGSGKIRKDTALTRVEAPENVYLGERVRVSAQLKLYGVPGREVVVSLRDGQDVVLEQQTIKVPAGEERYRTEVDFTDVPGDEGLRSYAVRIETDFEGEDFTGNKVWRFQTAVSGDRKNVLLVDGRPRWEFRYLRNLFHGRDKSVHLQYVLTQGDLIHGVETAAGAGATASAARPFGQSEANRLPENLDEWRKFDVIIIGDVSPAVLDESVLEKIEHCVKQRGAALVVIAGPRYMPHKYTSSLLRDLLPVVYVPSAGNYFPAPESRHGFRMRLTREGSRHRVMRLAPGLAASEMIWTGLPELQWRYPAADVKPGATVLAYAEAMGEQDAEEIALADLATRVDEIARLHRRNSLISFHHFGVGRVMMFNFDRTWRLRYRLGDDLHHAFWRQVMGWGAGENLRAGRENVRIGTDGINYGPGQPVKVTARLREEDHSPVTGDTTVKVVVSRNDTPLAEYGLRYISGSQGMYEAEIGPFPEPGYYRIELSGDTAQRLAGGQEKTSVTTGFRVATVLNAVELSELTADKELAARIARASGGQVVPLSGLASLYDAFGHGTRESEPERADLALWDHWVTLLLFFSLFTAEWLYKRKSGLP